MTESVLIANLLGGQRVLKRQVKRERDLESLVKRGLSPQSVRALAANLASSLGELQAVAAMDRSTFARRDRESAPLKSDESDRIVRIARIAARAIEVIGREDGLAWMREPNRALDERVPMDMLQTEVGARQVEHILGRLEHGVFS